ncbi:outer membrane protein TolC [Actimicrobium sp. GrIS 1.19]|uniref:TolC family protein n=1 Tax=Actimicrobium sp. GrIS 1.19 TaxID=3071708 RepID=UPI002E04CE54|nr:outer membrane protein TolC [Actimicrobium sp. GrIS 1.19]
MPLISLTRLRPVLLLAGMFSLAAHATDAPLTLAAAQQRAIAHSRQLGAHDAATAAAWELAVAAAQLPDPVLKTGIDNLPVTGADRLNVASDFMTMRRIGVMQELTGSAKRTLRSAVQLRQADKSIAQKSASRTEIRRATALAWLDRYYAEQMLRVMDEQLVQAHAEVDAAARQYRNARSALTEVLSTQSALALLDDQRNELERRQRNAVTQLERWTGSIDPAPLTGRPDIHRLPLDGATLATALQREPQIATLAAQEEIARTEAQLAEAEKKSDWSVEVSFALRGPAYSNMASIGLSRPIQWDQGNRQDRAVSARLAGLEQARAERDEALRDRIAQTRMQLTDWEIGLQRHARYDTALLPLARQRSAATESAWRSGKATLTELLQARRGEIEVKLVALEHEAAIARLWAQLNFLLPDETTATGEPQ